MNIQSHLDNLIRKHKTLDKEIKRIETSAFTNQARLLELKKRKLKVKDNISAFNKRIDTR